MLINAFRVGTWFAVAVAHGYLTLSPANAGEVGATANQYAAAVPSLPADLPLPKSSPQEAVWLRQATILQPYGHSAYTALVDVGDRPSRLQKDFGFNAIIVQPPDSHNTIAAAGDQISEAQFRDGVSKYRDAGYRLILYTSLMANGLSPQFQSGELGRAHPDWRQVDAQEKPILVWGVPWLCPNSGARDLALERCLRIVRDYAADGVMLDNNQFFFAEGGGWTCHCDACTKRFREYVSRRFGVDGAKRCFGAEPNEITIPTDEGPLHALWLQWRNRVWADVNESFRARLRQENPDILFFANTQYAFDSAVLATDEQYEREDVVLSESCNLSSRQMSEKMVLGHALAAGRPLWNYVGTFAKPEDYTGLQPAEVIGPMIASTLAHGARPWIVDGFDDGPTNPDARLEMSRLLSWHATHQELFAADRWSSVATIISPISRNSLKRSLIPPHVASLQSAGTPVIALRDNDATADALRAFQVVTVETAGCLSDATAAALAKWVRGGGTLIANRDVGFYDDLGRKLPASNLWHALGLDAAPEGETPNGRGVVVAPEAGDFAQAALKRTQAGSFQLAPDSGVEVVCYRAPHELLLHIVRHQPTVKSVKLRIPDSFRPAGMAAELFVPGPGKPQLLPLSQDAENVSFELNGIPAYCIIKIKLT